MFTNSNIKQAEFRFWNGVAIEIHKLDALIHEALIVLPYNHDAYFILEEGHFLVSLSSLAASRARARGITGASRLMQQAAKGLRKKRLPIAVRAIPNFGFMVVDGNSTYLNAVISEWPDIPCVLEGSEATT
jgi:hypothetical protein